MTTCKDVSVEKSTQSMKDPIKIALINPKPLFDNNEESDDEDGGVLVRA
jgi:hypothetical protein